MNSAAGSQVNWLRVHAVPLAIIVIGAAAIAYRSRLAMSDDAYIMLRVVRQALEGRGLHFNPGEAGVQVSTSPLNLLLTLAFSWTATLFGATAETAVVGSACAIMTLSFAVCGAGIYALASPSSKAGVFSLLAALGVATSPMFISSGGLERALALGCALWGLFFVARDNLRVAGALLGCAVLARHDYGILLLIVATFVYRQSERGNAKDRLMKFAAPSAVAALPWIVFSAIYYGTTIPTTLRSKLAQGGSAYWPESYQSGIWDGIIGLAHGVPWLAAIAIAVTMVALMFAARDRGNQGDAAIALLLFSAVHAVAYSVLGLPRYHWYYIGYGVVLLLFCAYGLDMWIARRATARALSFAAVVLAIPFAYFFTREPQVEPRLAAYREAGRYLSKTPPKTAAGTKEIGIIGFYAPAVAIFDYAGLATPSQIENVRKSAATAWLSDPSVADVAVIVSSEPPHRDQPLEPRIDPAFEERFALEVELATPVFGDHRIQVWRLRD